MPATRTAKKSKQSKSTTNASSTTNARHNARREPVPEPESEAPHSEDTVPSQDSSVGNGGDVSEKAVADVIGDVMEAQKKRHSAAQASIRKSYDKSVAELKTAINDLFDEHEEEADTAHAAQITELQRLLAQKREIEAVMRKRVAKLQRAYVVLGTLVADVYEGRVAQL